ncbi:MdtA/MuxA family multidrug efflux RND transporter periplasmic adaptor subunit [Desulfovibrio sp. OttesenSCG-928-A18]|nr:MdtA/MuxA family multidrug efflux RND transporter periplasmic adaptor subunit [Desulfovibrio sp. OttesenSCG-928-A18]
MNDKRRWSLKTVVLLLILIGALAGGGAFVYQRFFGKQGGPPRQTPFSVRVAQVKLGNMPVYLQALGTVTPPNTVTVRSRVDGQLMALHFEEGRRVKAGDLLAEIDPRPFEVQKLQAQGQLARDEALLNDARLDLERYRKLIKEHSVSAQQLQAQEALVGQYEGAVIADRAAVADADLQITYSRVTAPISGRVGLRKVDVGNMIRASDAEGIVVITQMRPMHVLFTLVESQIPEVMRAMRQAGSEHPLLVEAWGQDNRVMLASGRLLTIDNQIDTATGTVRAKAEFANEDLALFPNQFINARLRIRELEQVMLIPTSAVQRNNAGFFVYVVEDGVTRMKSISSPYATDQETVVDSGLSPGDRVVVDGVDRLRDGTAVNFREDDDKKP